MRILSLDQDGSFQRDLAAELGASGHQVDLLSDSDEALACDAARPFDLVIVEARLGDDDAVGFLQDLRRARGGELPPAVVLTSDPEPGLRERCIVAGAVRFLDKSDGWPATTAEIYGVMAEVEPLGDLTTAVDPPRADSRIFRGNLETIEIVDIVQLLNLGRKTGTLILMDGIEESGRMHFDEGEVVAASASRLDGPTAFAELLLLRSGSFRFEAGPAVVERNVHQPTSTLLLDALRLHDEQGRVSHDGLGLGEGAPDPFAVAEAFDFEHRAPAELSLPDVPAADSTGWLYAGVADAMAAPDPARTFHADVPPPWVPAAETPVSAAPRASAPPPSAADLDISRTRLATSRRSRAPFVLPPRLGRGAVLAGLAGVILLGTGSVVLFSNALQGGAGMTKEEQEAYRQAMLDAAEAQRRLDSLETVITEIADSSAAGAAGANPESAKQIADLQNQVAEAEAARQAALLRQAAATREDREAAERERREREEQEVAEAPAAAPVAVAAADDSAPAPTDDASIPGGATEGRAGEAEPTPDATLPAAPARDSAVAPAAPAEPVPDYSLPAIRRAPQFVPVDVRPTARSPIRPAYPRALAERNIGGTVSLWVLVDAAGNVADVRVLRSSTWAELDRAAIEAIRRAAYNPARRGGSAVPTWTQQQVQFKLD